MTSAVIITSMLIFWSFWVRRHTWRCKWERATSLFVAFMLLTAVFTYPITANPIDTCLHAITHLYNLQYFLGEMVFIGGLGAIVHSSVNKLTPDQEFSRWFKRRIEVPLTLGAVAAFILFVFSKATDAPHRDFNTMQSTGILLSAYWLVYCAMVFYLLYHSTRALIDLWYDKASRKLVYFYLVANAFIAAGTLLRAIVAAYPPAPEYPMCYIAFICYAAGVAMFALGSGVSWLLRLRWFSHQPGWKRAFPSFSGWPRLNKG